MERKLVRDEKACLKENYLLNHWDWENIYIWKEINKKRLAYNGRLLKIKAQRQSVNISHLIPQ